VAWAQGVLKALGAGEFLPGFEEMEKRATNGRGIAGQIVADVRAQIDNLRADIAVAVGEALLDRGQAAEAVAVLEPIVKGSDDRDDVARILSTALRELGQHDRAAEIRRRYAVGQGS
jgi:predicted Zn-dependent protease